MSGRSPDNGVAVGFGLICAIELWTGSSGIEASVSRWFLDEATYSPTFHLEKDNPIVECKNQSLLQLVQMFRKIFRLEVVERFALELQR